MPKGIRRSEEEKEAIRQACAALPRSDGSYSKKHGRKIKRGQCRVKKGAIWGLLERFNISAVALWKIVYGVHPWNNGRERP